MSRATRGATNPCDVGEVIDGRCIAVLAVEVVIQHDQTGACIEPPVGEPDGEIVVIVWIVTGSYKSVTHIVNPPLDQVRSVVLRTRS